MAAVDLDDAAALRQVDVAGMLDHVAATPDQLSDAWARAQTVECPARYRDGAIKRIVGLGTGGGSRFALGLVRALVGDQLPVEFTLRQGYELPAAVGPETLVFALSHSGNTLETVATTQQAIRRQARLIVVTAGGQLAQQGELAGASIHRIADQTIMPRAAIGHLVAPVLRALADLGLIADPSPRVAATVGYLRVARERYAPSRPAAENLAKQLARHCLTGLPLIFTSALTEAVADRLARQLAENGKVWSAIESLPEAHHDKIVGLGYGQPDIAWAPIFIRSAWESAAIDQRFAATRTLLRNLGVADLCLDLRIDAADRWEELFELVQLVDYASCYAALTRAIDPTAVAVIDQLKRVMGQPG